MKNQKNNFVVYFKGKRNTIKIASHSSLLAAQCMVNDLKEGTKGKGYPYIAVVNPMLVKRI